MGTWLRYFHRPGVVAKIAAIVLTGLMVGEAAAPAASSSVTVTLSVASSTNLTTTGCSPDVAGVTRFGNVLPGTSAVTTIDCALAFGSSNDTAQLRMSQTDSEGRGMWGPSLPVLDTSFGTAGLTTWSASTGLYDIHRLDDGRLLAVGYDNTCNSLIARFSASGVLDTTFNPPNGFHNIPIGGGCDSYSAVTVTADGKYLAVGTALGDRQDITVARYLADGTLDSSFGGGAGWLQLPLDTNTDDSAVDVVALPDGRILFSGASQQSPCCSTDHDFFVGRLTSTGAWDTTFSGDGKLRIPLTAGNDYARDMRLDSAGRIVVSGSTRPSSSGGGVLRLLGDGTPDPTFGGGDGMMVFDVVTWNETIGGLAVLDDDSILVGGTDEGSMYVVKVAPTGVLDTTFGGGDGISTLIPAGTNAVARDLLAHPGGGIVGVGDAVGTNRDPLVARWSADGAATNFGGDGSQSFVYGALADEAHAATWSSDGRIVIAGVMDSGAGTVAALSRVDSARLRDYALGVDDWDTPGDDVFGVCLRSIAGIGASALWSMNATCPQADGAHWNALPATGASTEARVANSTTATTTNVAVNLRFGVRTRTDQPPGGYVAPVRIEVVAPFV